MNKVFYALLISTFTFNACTEYKCTCIDPVNAQPTQVFHYENMNEKEAKERCSKENHNNTNYYCVLTEE